MTKPAELGKRKHRSLIEEAFFVDQSLAEGQRLLLAEVIRLQQTAGRPDFSTMVRLLSAQSEKLVKLHGVHQETQGLIDRAPDEAEDWQAQIEYLQEQIDLLSGNENADV